MTYSILGRDPETGELGVAVQSQAFNTGAAVPWAHPGVGVIATQSFTDRRYGFRGLELLAEGATPQAALDQLREPDPLTGFRQVAFMDASGTTAQWTGGDCIPHAGNAAGENWCAQGNMLAADAWVAMGEAFTSTTGSLAQRLMSALDAAEAEGGDFRGRGGAGIVVVPAEGEPWERMVDLRVEDGDDSLVQLRRLLGLAEGYRRANRARPASPGAAENGLPDSYVRFLAILDAAADGDPAEARKKLDELAAEQPLWREAFRRFARHPEMPPLGAIIDPQNAQ
ncbi:MAG TPA: DUF1028 domain-containing protein [Gaiellaceae bacterium]|jgi:uncharacterized Ntn-hydrolase superfamily protein